MVDMPIIVITTHQHVSIAIGSMSMLALISKHQITQRSVMRMRCQQNHGCWTFRELLPCTSCPVFSCRFFRSSYILNFSARAVELRHFFQSCIWCWGFACYTKAVLKRPLLLHQILVLSGACLAGFSICIKAKAFSTCQGKSHFFLLLITIDHSTGAECSLPHGLLEDIFLSVVKS